MISHVWLIFFKKSRFQDGEVVNDREREVHRGSPRTFDDIDVHVPHHKVLV